MNSKKSKDNKEGMSVKEIEEFAKRHRFEVYFSLMFFLAYIFGIIGYFRSGWSCFSAMIGSIAGIILPYRVEQLMEKIFLFIFKQERTVLFILAAVGLILSIFTPFVIFLAIGLCGGYGIYKIVSDSFR